MTLSVSLNGQPVTGIVSGLQIKNVAVGGYASVSFNLNRKLDKALLDTFTDVLVYDTATGEQVGGGRLMEQGRNDDGTWAITCLGEGLASMQDRNEPYMLIATDYEPWYQWRRGNKRMTVQQGTTPSGATDGLFLAASDGAIATGDFVVAMDDRLAKCNQTLGGFEFQDVEGAASTDWSIRSYVYNDGSSAQIVHNQPWTTSVTTRGAESTTNWTPGGVNGLTLRIWRDGAGFTAGDNTWAHFRNIRVSARRYNQAGAVMEGSIYQRDYVLAHEAFIDIMARFCPRLDLANAQIDTATYQADQLVWLDGVTPMKAMEDVLSLEPAFTWQVWDKKDNGLWETSFTALPSSVRYEASTVDGFSAPSPTTEIYNKVIVRGTTKYGNSRVKVVTSTVPVLDAAGIVRSTTIDLGDELYSDGNATKFGQNFLADHAFAPNAGTLTIAQPIYDAQTGRWVKPHAIRSGGLIRVRGIQPTPDTLNATSPDGVTVFRVVSATYDDDAGAATLELDTYQLTESRALATLARKRGRKR